MGCFPLKCHQILLKNILQRLPFCHRMSADIAKTFIFGYMGATLFGIECLIFMLH